MSGYYFLASDAHTGEKPENMLYWNGAAWDRRAENAQLYDACTLRPPAPDGMVGFVQEQPEEGCEQTVMSY